MHTRLGAKRGKRRKGPCVKDAKQPRRQSRLRRSGSGRYGVRRSQQKIGNSNGHWFRPAPVSWANLTLVVKFRPSVFFSFGPCTARFLFSAQPKRENGGCIAQPSSWLKSTPPVRANKNHPRPKGGHPRLRPEAGFPRPRPRREIPRPPAGGPPPHQSKTFGINYNSHYRKES